jgi:3-oxoacyl-[acyl-carrier protein] reductase
MDLGLKGKRVLISGSSRGIGLAIARGFLQEGAKVVLTSRHVADLDAVKCELSKLYLEEQILAIPCDFCQSQSIQDLKNKIHIEWGGVDILVANVGSGNSVQDPIPPREKFEKVFQINFNSAVLTVREFFPQIQKNQGNILFLSSIAGMEAIGAPVDYSTAKAALFAFAKNLARKVASEGVRVNCIAPGNILFVGGSWEEKIKTNPTTVQQMLESTVPMKRFGTPAEIADTALFICSERGSFITGSVFKVDGGQTVGHF